MNRKSAFVLLILTVTAIAAIAACGSFSADSPSDEPDAAADASGESDATATNDGGDPSQDSAATIDAGQPCDPDAAFEHVDALLGENDTSGAINTVGVAERGAHLSADEKTLFFHREAGGKSTIFTATRDVPSGPFRAPVQVTLPGNGANNDANPMLSPDGLTLWFDSDRTNPTKGLYEHTIWSAKKVVNGSGWAEPIELASVSRPAAEPFLTKDDELFLTFTPPAGAYEIRRANPSTTQPASVSTVVNSVSSANTHPVISADGLTMYFARKPTGSVYTIFIAHRATAGSPFTTAQKLATVGATEANLNMNKDGFFQSPLFISNDNCRLYFEKSLLNPNFEEYDLFVATRPPQPSSK